MPQPTSMFSRYRQLSLGWKILIFMMIGVVAGIVAGERAEVVLANSVKLAIRRGVLRFSLHVYNNEDDVDRVVQLAREWRLLSTS